MYLLLIEQSAPISTNFPPVMPIWAPQGSVMFTFFYQYALQVLRKLILVSYLCFLHFFKFTIPPVIGISSICGSFERYQSITYFLQLAVFFRQQFTPVKHDKRNKYSKY